MAAQIEFTATEADGTVHTRTSGTMPYVAFAGGTWHKSFAAAHKAATDRYHAAGTVVIPVVPTKIVGKLGSWTPHIDGWGDIPASAFTELVEAKLPALAPAIEAPAKETPAQARARQRAAKKQREADAAVQAELDAQAAARAAVPTGASILAGAVLAAEPVAKAEPVEVDVATMVLVKVDGKPQARLDATSGTLVWRNSAKGRAARAAGIWA